MSIPATDRVSDDPSSPPLKVYPRLRAFYVLTKIFMKYIIRVTVRAKHSVSAETNLAVSCTRPAYHHLDVRTDFAPQVQNLLNVCAV